MSIHRLRSISALGKNAYRTMTTRKYSERKEFTVQAAPCSEVLDLSSGRIEEAGPILGNHTESRFGVFVITVGLTGEIDRQIG